MKCTCLSHNGFLTRRGYEMITSPQVDKTEVDLYLDRVGSVSGLRRDEDLYDSVPDELIDQQHQRFLNGY